MSFFLEISSTQTEIINTEANTPLQFEKFWNYESEISDIQSTNFMKNFIQFSKIMSFHTDNFHLKQELDTICQNPTESIPISFSEVKVNNFIPQIPQISFSNENSLLLPKKSRKWGRDSFQKKIKCMFMKYVVSFFQTRLGKTYVQKLPQKLVTNVTKKYNRELLNADLKSFGKSHLGLTDTDFFEYGRDFDFSKTTLSMLFEDYLRSVNFEKDLLRIREKEDEQYLITLKGYLLEFIGYYCQKNSEKTRKKESKLN